MSAEPIPLRRRRREPNWRARALLAASILAHGRWCPACKPHIDDALKALDGKTIDEITGGG